jgi:hypothetical protein
MDMKWSGERGVSEEGVCVGRGIVSAKLRMCRYYFP